MAQARNKRRGFSRKAQYGLFTGYVLAIAGAIVGLFLIALSYFDPTGFALLRNGAAEATAPISRSMAAARDGVRNSAADLTAYWDAGDQNIALRRQLAEQHSAMIAADHIRAENAELRTLLELSERGTPPLLTSRLINSSAASTRRLARIGVGSRQGVAVGQPVQSRDGLVGRILDTGLNSARVLLISDTRSVIPVQRAGDDIAALSQGRGDGRVNIRLVNVGINPLEPGDIFVTSGNGGLYQPGVPVAVVEELTNSGAIGRIIADPATSGYVLVFPIYQPEITDDDVNSREADADSDSSAAPDSR